MDFLFFFNRAIHKIGLRKVLDSYSKKNSDDAQRRYLNNLALRVLNDGKKKVTIFYDNQVSPPTFGDFIYVVLIARLLVKLGVKVGFLLTNCSFREDWESLKADEQQEFVREQERLLNVFSCSKDLQIIIGKKDNLLKNLADVQGDSFVLFLDKIKLNKPVYVYGFNFLNSLMSLIPERQRDLVLLNSLELRPHISEIKLDKSFISWHCRFSPKWGHERNLTEKEFKAVANNLALRFPGREIMIVSDHIGCSHYKELARKMGFSFLFSKDYASDFIDDCWVILESDFYFQFKGGGIGTIPLFSKMPYEIRAKMVHERKWRGDKTTSWQSSEQKFIDTDCLD